MDSPIVAEIKRRGIPSLYGQQNVADPIIYLEFALSRMPWRWYAAECEIEAGGDDVLFFGFVCGADGEGSWGDFRLSELEDAPWNLLVSLEFQPLPFSELKREYNPHEC